VASKYYYNYAVVDPKYPEEPKFWALSGYSLGNAAKIHWTFDFVPEADATTQLLLSNLHRQNNKITLAIPVSPIPTKEPKWETGISYDQLIIRVESDADYGMKRKLVFFHIQVKSVKQVSDRKLGGAAKVVLCHVGRDGYVAANK
jgi:hypothetical protein